MILPGGTKTIVFTYEMYVKTTAAIQDQLELVLGVEAGELPASTKYQLDSHLGSLVGTTISKDELYSSLLMVLASRPAKVN